MLDQTKIHLTYPKWMRSAGFKWNQLISPPQNLDQEISWKHQVDLYVNIPWKLNWGTQKGNDQTKKNFFSWSQVFELPFSIAQGRVTQINFKFVNSFLLIVDKNHPNIRSKKVVFSTESVLDPPKNSLPSLGSWQGVLSSASSKRPRGPFI